MPQFEKAHPSEQSSRNDPPPTKNWQSTSALAGRILTAELANVSLEACLLKEDAHGVQGSGGMGHSCRKDRTQIVNANVVPDRGAEVGTALACSTASCLDVRGWGLKQPKVCQQSGNVGEVIVFCKSGTRLHLGKRADNTQVANALGRPGLQFRNFGLGSLASKL